MSKLNLFKRPIEAESLDAWAKMSDDIAKVSALATPVVIFGNSSFVLKIINILLLAILVYACMITGRIIRQHKQK
ncbi:hypothetical protein GVX81_00310 [[Haemophilus] felis]|uniref:Uncharacterized protein n=1 Tax=[Haemophilus] felis TaxID=123822 RepID=A0A1T0B6Q3_9PAST|nr:hypothetical protein [[Haemophilus] felis]OOS05890.1 hypothetical protein B0188_03235 [[Haemophilus] felis]